MLCCWELGLPCVYSWKGRLDSLLDVTIGVVVAMVFAHERGGWEVFWKLFPLSLNCFHKFSWDLGLDEWY